MVRCIALLFVSLFPFAAFAQVIPIKTVPVAQGDQFLLFPAENRGMAGVSIALDDRLHDPFANPAKAVNAPNMAVTTPSYYGFAGDGGAVGQASGRTLPVGVLARGEGLFAGALMAWQELIQQGGRIVTGTSERTFTSTPRRLSDTGSNLYGFGLAGLTIPATRFSAGLSVFAADLNALEGIRHLYPNSTDLREQGEMQHYRAGLYYDAPRRSAELILLHHRTDMTHTMMRQAEGWGMGLSRHEEYDKTYGWALQAGYKQHAGRGWQVGGRLVANLKQHPKIPNYELMQIPRDPGTSSAFRIGLGLAREWNEATFAADLIYEPIWSHTWVNALEDTETVGGSIISAGEMTVENHFRFDNATLRMGLNRSIEWFDLSLGLAAHRINYHLDQADFVQERIRDQDESWIEWTPSLGLGADMDAFRVHYLGRMTLGVGRPGTVRTGFAGERAFADAEASIVLAPNGPLTLQETRAFTHQVSVVVPLQ